MSVLGKVLIIFNLLAAGAFGYMTLENWKVRQELTYREFENVVKIGGVPVEAPTAPADIGEGRVPFNFRVNKGTTLDSIAKETLEKLIPKGDADYGGASVANQTEEVTRLQKQLQTLIAAKVAEAGAKGAEKKQELLRQYLLNLARSGTERDGVNALFDMADDVRKGSARRDLPLLGRTASQTAGLKALVEITNLGDPQAMPQDVQVKQLETARLALKSFIKGEAAHGVTDADAKLRLRDTTIEAAFRQGAGDAEKNAIVTEATADAAGFKFLADLAINPLNTRGKIDEAKASILGYVSSKAVTTHESAALKEIVDCIAQPAGFAVAKAIDTAGTQLLDHKFEEASMPSATKEKPTGNPLADKARRIAHLLYHIDAHRHDSRDSKVIGDRREWHQRVATIIGLQEYVRAAEAQASELTDAGQRLLAVISEEEAAFSAQYQTLVQYCQSLHSEWLAKEAQLAQQKGVEQTNDQLLKERQTEHDNLVNTLEEARGMAKEAQDRLAQVQQKRFDILKDLRDAQQALLQLEGELRRLELVKEPR